MKKYFLDRTFNQIAELDKRLSLLQPGTKPWNELVSQRQKLVDHLTKIDKGSIIWDAVTYLLFFIGLLIMCSYLFSCSNSKKVSNQVDGISALKNKMDSLDDISNKKAIADYIKNNPCICPVLKLDSLCSLYYPCENECAADQSSSMDTILSIKPPKKLVSRPQILIQPCDDSRLVNQQKTVIDELMSQLKECQGNIAGRSAAVKEVLQASEPGPWHFNYWSWIVIALTFLYILKVYLTKKIC